MEDLVKSFTVSRRNLESCVNRLKPRTIVHGVLAVSLEDEG